MKIGLLPNFRGTGLQPAPLAVFGFFGFFYQGLRLPCEKAIQPLALHLLATENRKPP
jgi:hypothetical protein